MELKLIRKTRECLSTSCPALFKVISAPGGSVVIGKDLDKETLARYAEHVGPGESAVWVPDDVL